MFLAADFGLLADLSPEFPELLLFLLLFVFWLSWGEVAVIDCWVALPLTGGLGDVNRY